MENVLRVLPPLLRFGGTGAAHNAATAAAEARQAMVDVDQHLASLRCVTSTATTPSTSASPLAA